MSTVIEEAWASLRVAQEQIEQLEREAAGQRYLNEGERKEAAKARKDRRARASVRLSDWKRRRAVTYHAKAERDSFHPSDPRREEDRLVRSSASLFFGIPLEETSGIAKLRQRGFSIFRITQDLSLLTSKATAQFDGTSREEDLANVYQYDDLAEDTQPGSDLKMEVTRALNISRFHGYQGTEIDRHSKAFRRAVFENPHVLGHHHYQREGEHILSSVDLAGLQTYTNGYEVADGATVTGEVDRFFATCSRRRNLNLNREGHKNLWLRVNLGRSLPKAGSPGWKSAFIIEPFRLISCYSADECEDIAYRWKVELELGADEQPSRDFDTVLGSQQRSQREIEVDPIKYALPVLKPSRADAWLGRPIGPLGDAHLTDEQRKAIAARRAAN